MSGDDAKNLVRQVNKMNDIHGRGAAGRVDAPSVADVGGAAGPGEGAAPTSGDDASGDAGGARVGGSDPVGPRNDDDYVDFLHYAPEPVPTMVTSEGALQLADGGVAMLRRAMGDS